jgi:N-methylhydantoinase B
MGKTARVAVERDAKSSLDAVTFEVLRSTFVYACDRMTMTLKRASFSPILADMLDFSNAIYDANANLVAQAANCPVHLAAMKFSAEAVIKHFGIENLRPGDVVAVNDPYSGGTHINDITFVMPVYFQEELLGLAVSRGHWMDLGGGAAGGQAFHGTHIAGEGLRLPPTKIVQNHEVREEILQILLHNTRTPHFVRGDLQAHMGCLRAASEELTKSAERYGMSTVKRAMKELQEYTERIIRKSIELIPDGRYEASESADTDGFSDTPIGIKVCVEVRGDEILVDFAGTDPICKGAINSPQANTYSAVYYSLQFFLAPHAPQNQGMFNPISVMLPEGCWLNATWPAPTIGCTTLTSSKIASAVWQALAKALPRRVTGTTCAECNWFVASVKDDQGRTNVFSDLPAGGWGGTPFADGMSVTMDPLGNCMNMPAETAELLFPIAYEAFEMRQDSAGAGQHRGGLGAIFKVRFLSEGELSMETSRTLEGSPGANGGGNSALQRQLKISSTGQREVIGGLDDHGAWRNPLLSAYPFKRNEVFMFESTGGGGWGNPLLRPVGEVLDDVLDEYISIECAAKEYGVVIDPRSLKVDAEATTARRALGGVMVKETQKRSRAPATA